jgi:hypothetical protein
LLFVIKKFIFSSENKKTENSMNGESEMERHESMFSSHKDIRQQIKIRNVSEKVEEWGTRETVKLNIESESVRKKFDLSQCMINSAS